MSILESALDDIVDMFMLTMTERADSQYQREAAHNHMHAIENEEFIDNHTKVRIKESMFKIINRNTFKADIIDALDDFEAGLDQYADPKTQHLYKSLIKEYRKINNI